MIIISSFALVIRTNKLPHHNVGNIPSKDVLSESRGFGVRHTISSAVTDWMSQAAPESET